MARRALAYWKVLALLSCRRKAAAGGGCEPNGHSPLLRIAKEQGFKGWGMAYALQARNRMGNIPPSTPIRLGNKFTTRCLIWPSLQTSTT